MNDFTLPDRQFVGLNTREIIQCLGNRFLRCRCSRWRRRRGRRRSLHRTRRAGPAVCSCGSCYSGHGLRNGLMLDRRRGGDTCPRQRLRRWRRFRSGCQLGRTASRASRTKQLAGRNRSGCHLFRPWCWLGDSVGRLSLACVDCTTFVQVISHNERILDGLDRSNLAGLLVVLNARNCQFEINQIYALVETY